MVNLYLNYVYSWVIGRENKVIKGEDDNVRFSGMLFKNNG